MKRLLALLAILSLLLAACGGGPQAQSPPPPADAPGGGYLESPCPLPQEAGRILALQVLNDGTLVLLGCPERYGQEGWLALQSSDGGKSWQEHPLPYLQGEGRGQNLTAARLYPDGSATLLALDSYEEQGDELVWHNRLLRLSADGQVTQERTFTLKGRFYYPLSFRELAGGGLLVETENGLLQLDGQNLEVENTYMEIQGVTFERPFEDYALVGGTLAITQGDVVACYDPESGEMVGSFDTLPTAHAFYTSGAMRSEGRERLLLPRPDGKALFYCDQNGIFSHALEGGINERIADGAISSLNLPTRLPHTLLEDGDGGFYVLFEEIDSYFLAHYTYREDIRQGETVLRAYSLFNTNDKRVRQAVGQYQIEHPGVRVEYSAGVHFSEGGGQDVSMEDAKRTLATQLLAGNGPDVLVLDSLPVDSFVRQGVLQDLSGLAAPHTQPGEWLPSVVEGLKQGDKLYGVPAAFTLPVVLADAGIAGELGDLDSLVAWAEKAKQETGLPPFCYVDYASILWRFYPLCSDAWMRGERVEPEPLAAFLSAAARLVPLLDDTMKPWNISELDEPSYVGWYTGETALAVGDLRSVYDLAVLTSLFATGERPGTLAPLLPQGDRYFYTPTCVLGVNAASALQEEAFSFIETALSEQVQPFEFFDGMPVNARVLQNQLTSTGIHYSGPYNMWKQDGTSFQVPGVWPDPAAAQAFLGIVENAALPLFSDGTMAFLLIESAEGIPEGTTTPEKAAQDFAQVAALRGAE